MVSVPLTRYVHKIPGMKEWNSNEEMLDVETCAAKAPPLADHESAIVFTHNLMGPAGKLLGMEKAMKRASELQAKGIDTAVVVPEVKAHCTLHPAPAYSPPPPFFPSAAQCRVAVCAAAGEGAASFNINPAWGSSLKSSSTLLGFLH